MYITHGMLIKYTTYQNFVAAIMLARDLNLENLYLPYVPCARQDKPRNKYVVDADKASGDILDSLGFTFDLIKLAGFKKVFVMDPHSDKVRLEAARVGLSFYDTTKWISKEFKRSADVSYDGVIAPDHGATERALAFAKELDVPLLLGSKTRNAHDNSLSNFSVAGVHKDEHYLVVDDICDGGGTFLGLYDGGIFPIASADLFVTHGLFTKGAGSRLRTRYQKVFTTDSLGWPADHVTIIPMVDQLMQFEDAEYLTIEEGKR